MDSPVKTSLTHSIVAAGLALAASGCPSMNHTHSGAVVGSGLGALTGAVIGSNSGHAPGGALIGAHHVRRCGELPIEEGAVLSSEDG